MGWFKADPVSARAGSAGVVVSLLRPPSAKAVTLRMRLGREAMRRTGWAADRRVELLWGDEGHAGKVMLRPAEAGPRLRFPHKRAPHFLETTFGHVPRGPIPGAGGAEWTLPAEVRPSAEAEWSVEEGALVVTLPREWWQVATPASVAGRGEAAVAPSPPDPTDPALQEMVLTIVGKGGRMDDALGRTGLDAAGKAVLRDLISLRLRRGARAGVNGAGAAA